LSTTPVTPGEHDPKINHTPSEVDITPGPVCATPITEHTPSEVDITPGPVCDTLISPSRPSPEIGAQTATSLSQTHEFEHIGLNFDLHEEQSPSWTNTFLDDEHHYTTNRPFTLGKDYNDSIINIVFLLHFSRPPILAFSPPDDIFRQNATVFEIANFVAEHPEILSTANMIHQSKRTSWNKPSASKEPLFGELQTLIQNEDNKQPAIKESTFEV
jgi:hypothetical protein